MRGAVAIATRELSSYFRQPAGWIIIALYLLLSGMVFALAVLVRGEPASLRYFFASSGWLMLPVAPAISMRLISEELRSGTFESLMTSPLSGPSLVLGKFIGACMFMLAMLIPTGIYVAVLFRFASPAPDLGPLVSGYLCLILMGLMYLAVGTLASALTSNATLAFMVTLFAILGFLFMGSVSEHAPDTLRPILFALTITPRVLDFSRGVIDTGHIVFFLSASAWFLVLAIAAVELRRWR
jgi:ABC-2 type transport system permease protein